MEKIIGIRQMMILSGCVLVLLTGCTSSRISSQFPLPETVKNFVQQDVAGDAINFQTNAKSDELLAFYTEQFTAQGLRERELLTVQTNGTISIVFDGHEKGSIIVQAVDMPNGDTNVNIRFEQL